jgi:hypothetical protein
MYHVGAPDRTTIPILDENRLEAARVVIDGVVNQDLAHHMAAAPLLLSLLEALCEEAADVCPTKPVAEAVVDYLRRPRLPCPTCTGAGSVEPDALNACGTCSGSGTIAGPTPTPALEALLAGSLTPAPAARAPAAPRVRIPSLKRFEQIGLKRLHVEGPKRGPTLSDPERSALVGLSMQGRLVTHSDVQGPEGFLFELTPEGERVARELLRRGETLNAAQVRLLKRLEQAGEVGVLVSTAQDGTARVLREEVVPPFIEFVPGEAREAPAGPGEPPRSEQFVRRWWQRRGRAHLVTTEGAVMTLCKRNAGTAAWSEAPAEAKLCDTCGAEASEGAAVTAAPRQRLTAAGRTWLTDWRLLSRSRSTP